MGKLGENVPLLIDKAQTPIIGARIGGIPELVEEDKTGFTFESGNIADLKDWKSSTMPSISGTSGPTNTQS